MTQSPEIDFGRIRPHGGSRNDGFEELCAQLAGLEEREKSDLFVRTGKGADAGVECYCIRDDETERGWQAKYVFEWDDSLASQLNKSIEAALDKHPKLTEYVVCLPFNLPDAQQKNRKSQREKWNTWKAKWEGKAKKEGRSLTIDLWDATALSTRLNVDRPELSGRRYYWFNETELTHEWFKSVFERARSDLGSRYTPETNIELPIRKAFAGCARELRLNKVLQRWAVDVADDVSGVQFSLGRMSEEEKAEDQVLTFQTVLEKLIDSLSKGPFGLDEKFPIEDFKAKATEARTVALDLLYWVYQKRDDDDEGERSKPDFEYARIKLGAIADNVARIADALDGDEWRLANADAVLLSGDAGTGKSHLLADVVQHQVHNGFPAILVLGSYMVDGDPWQQILRILDLPAHVRATDLLGALDAAAEAHESRVLVCVDAINERNGTSVWPHRIGSFLKLAESFPRVIPVLSCRTTYLARMVPKQVAENLLSQIKHLGFADEGGKAAKLYLAKRGIVRPGAPNLVPEMHVPLFLKSVCDALDRRGETEIPRGLRGTSALFQFYNAAIIEAVTEKLDLDPRLGQVQAAIISFAQLLAEQGEGYATYSEANSLFEKILPSHGSVERGLLPQLESDRESLTAVWVIAGEKAVYGTGHSSSGYGGSLDHTGIYRLDDRVIVQHHLQVDPKPPGKDDYHRRIVDRILAKQVALFGWPEFRPARREFSIDMLTVGKRACVVARVKATCCYDNCAGSLLLNLNRLLNSAERYRRKRAVLYNGEPKNEGRFARHHLRRSRSVFGPFSQMPPTSERCRPATSLPLKRLTLVVALCEKNGLRRLENGDLAGLTEHPHGVRYCSSICHLRHPASPSLALAMLFRSRF